MFVLICGYFSAMPKKTSLVNLTFICLFWMIIQVAIRWGFGEPITRRYLFFVTSSNWFIPSYIGLLLLSPILNTFCNSVSKKVLWGGVIVLLLYEMWFDWLPPRPDGNGIGANQGFSVFSFAILYLLSRAVRLHGLPNWFKKYSFAIYVICSFTIAVVAYVAYVLKLDEVAGISYYSYINPLVILSSVAFLTMFSRINMQSKVINHLAKSTLAVLFGHSAITFLYTRQFRWLYDNCSGIKIIEYWILSVFLVFVACIAIDQIRLLLYRPINDFLKRKIRDNNLFED